MSQPALEIGARPLGVLAADHTRMAATEASELARRLWSLPADAVRLDTEKDDTFRLQTDAGDKFILKVSNPSDDPTEVDCECGLIQHVGASAPDVPVPRMVPQVDGRLLAPIRDAAGQERLARLMTYLEGTPLDSTDSSAIERERVGETLAKLRHATARYSHAADRRRCAWDITNLPSLRPLVSTVEDGRKRQLLQDGFERYMDQAAPYVPGLRRQVLHNDFSKSNILVDHQDPRFVTGIVDFGDAVHTAIAIDLSTALLNQLPQDAGREPSTDFFADGRDLLRGYLRYADLTQDEFALLPHLVMGRVVARAVITLYRAAKMPVNRKYILRNTEQGWSQLSWFLQRDPGELLVGLA